jgi:uncharacterized membrane protein
MRTLADRIRHAISFEVIALMLVIPLASLVFHQPMHDIGVISVVSATIAMLWNVAYNFLFDLWLKRTTGNTLKSRRVRVLHAVLFEGGLLIALMPFIAWYLSITLAQAFVMDVSFALFYMAYAFAFNWAYDWMFPLAEWKQAAAQD